MTGDVQSYYGRPVVKPHVWTPYVPLYFWIGGATGVACAHAAVERLRGNHALADVQKRVALAGIAISPVLLIVDLGVPLRFLNMLRVFKPTSPMSVGSWLLTALGGIVAASNAADFVGARKLGRALEFPAALLGPCLTAYTAALLADTATPIWHEAAGELPFLFAASGIAGAGACGTAFAPHESSGSARRMMILGALGTVAAARWMERKLGTFLAEPYRKGTAGALERISAGLALGGAGAALYGRKCRFVNTVAAALVAGSGIVERYAILEAGKESARDPKYTVRPQRERLERSAGAHLEPGFGKRIVH